MSDYILENLERNLLPNGLPKQVVHGDPKISNIVFRRGKGICMIDLDTCMIHSPLVDIGDALRSWCSLEEDNPNNKFITENFNFAVMGIEENFKFYDKKKNLIVQAIILITLELASRFAVDIVNDNYFGFDEKRYQSRRDHNLARVIGQVELVKDIFRQKQSIIK